jgi:hypothetical protein
MLLDRHGRPRVGHLRTDRSCADGRDTHGHDGEDNDWPPDFSPAKPYPDRPATTVRRLPGQQIILHPSLILMHMAPSPALTVRTRVGHQIPVPPLLL